ncbi:ABC transporter substrate-binding protein [Falsochrobactrum shanghaiense]|uniref:ABC transporter substrate-binding protein n=1 Tax=Falsochrobactrum shanghaiense TaxID=2201899 RepID=A0A316J931_9HYPH|nr:ABC transporter substrate-binding protein [Falsochrobactrum shanghaiense]PWL18477.1 ABC transporter substrate-binding protein [Falsochrobactrum shanghaiense]
MKKLLASTCLIGGLFIGASSASAADCGNIVIASMNWQSAEVLSNLDKIILNEGYGCSAEITVGDTVPTLTSMAERGQPDIAPEAWVDLLPDIIGKGTQEGTIVEIGSPLPDGGIQGWYIPQFTAEAHPEIKTIPDMLKHPELFPSSEDSSKGAVLNGPQGWGGTVTTSQLFKALEGQKSNFTLVDTGSAAGLDGAIAKAYERNENVVAFYWEPTALLGKYPMVRLDPGVEHDAEEWKRCNTVADCPDPKPNAFPVDRIVTLVAKGSIDKIGPDAMSYIEKRSWSNDTVSKLMAWMTDNQASGEDGAKHFLKNNKDLWADWVSPEAAEKIEASL